MLFEKRVTSKVEYSSGSVVLEYGLSSKKEEEVTVIAAPQPSSLATNPKRNPLQLTIPRSVAPLRPTLCPLTLCPLALLCAGRGLVAHPQGLPGVRLQRGGKAGV